jgi:3-dehydroquinate synthase
LYKLDIFADQGTYDLYVNAPIKALQHEMDSAKVIIVDRNVFNLYNQKLHFDQNKILFVDAIEEQKTPQTALALCEELVTNGFRRGDSVCVIGGGITQDLATFATSILYRGVSWVLFPTTLLAGADSCIGGKSSLNFKSWKNILGNFYPPERIYVNEFFFETLAPKDMRSGIGEIFKVHLLSGKESVDALTYDFEAYQDGSKEASSMIKRSLELKNNILKEDALDKGLRLTMNYGHTFGHALEAATHFAIPHGIAVTFGLDIANFVAFKQGLISEEVFESLHILIMKNIENSDYIY